MHLFRSTAECQFCLLFVVFVFWGFWGFWGLHCVLLAEQPSELPSDAAATDSDGVLVQDERISRYRSYEQYALRHAGDAAKGRALFLDKQRTKCGICHRVGGDGGQVGPDLSSIGGKFDRPHLIESLLEPSRQIVEGYRTSVIQTVDGRVLNGIVKERSQLEITFFDANDERHILPRKSIAEFTESSVSIMPQDLIDQLTRGQFTDLVAYLETLRPGGKSTNGAGVVGPITLPPGFEVLTITTGLNGATALETLPDGRLLICEQTGAVRVVERGGLVPEPFVTLPVDSTWERGVIGVTIDPAFPRQPYVYICWVAKDPYPHHRISRFTANGNQAVAGSEKVLLVGDDQRTMGGKVPAGHQGGALHFGADGKLYIGIGEQTAGEPSQKLDSLLGKLLRINADGTVPSDNPFVEQSMGKYRAIWARGLRNPFTFAVSPVDGTILINDVGGVFEEINVGLSGGNYGWPAVEHGPRKNSEFIDPIHWYPQASIAGGDFSRTDAAWPADQRGRYFFADFVHGWIKTLDPARPEAVATFATGLRRPVDLRFAPDGSLFVLLRNAWVIDNKFEGGTGSLLRIRYDGRGQAADVDAPREGGIKLTEDAADESAGGLRAYKIETPAATYYLEKSGAGLSSLVDRDGNDWLSFHPRAGSRAGGEFRGFPNAVHHQAGNYFHPRNTGTDPAVTRVEYSGPDRVSIVAESDKGHWACRYDFFPARCDFTMTRLPDQQKFWVLYEGTPGGKLDATNWWMTSAIAERQPISKRHDGDIPAPEWIAFGTARLERAIVLVQHTDDAHPDTFYAMDDRMTVFGFGRQGLTKYLDRVPASFSIALLESSQHDHIAPWADAILSRGDK